MPNRFPQQASVAFAGVVWSIGKEYLLIIFGAEAMRIDVSTRIEKKDYVFEGRNDQ